MTRVAVVGAGIAGLSVAYRLQKLFSEKGLPLELSIFDRASEAGGVLQTNTQDGFLLETGPDCFISEKPAGLALTKELGLEHQIIGTNPNVRQSFILKGHRLIPVPEGLYLMAPSVIWPFIKSPLVSWFGKLRMGMDLFLAKSDPDKDESLADFVTRRLGKEALDRIAQPMIAGIYTADPKHLSMKATMPIFIELEQKYGSIINGLRSKKRARSKGQPAKGTSGPRYSLFCSFKEGMQTLTDELEKQIGKSALRLNTVVQTIQKEDGRWAIEISDGKKEVFDLILIALPAAATSKLLSPIEPELSQTIGDVRYSSVATINFAYRREQIKHPLNGMGFVIPAVENRSMIACSFSSQKFKGRAPDDRVLLRAFAGGEIHEEILENDDSTLVKKIQKDLNQILSIEGEPEFTQVTRWQKSMPQYTVGHLKRADQIDEKTAQVPGLYLCGNGYRGVGIPDVIARSNDEAERALEYVLHQGSVSAKRKLVNQ